MWGLCLLILNPHHTPLIHIWYACIFLSTNLHSNASAHCLRICYSNVSPYLTHQWIEVPYLLTIKLLIKCILFSGIVMECVPSLLKCDILPQTYVIVSATGFVPAWLLLKLFCIVKVILKNHLWHRYRHQPHYWKSIVNAKYLCCYMITVNISDNIPFTNGTNRFVTFLILLTWIDLQN